MIVDLLASALLFVVQPVIDVLPTLDLGLPPAGGEVGSFLRKFDSLLPILGPLRLMLAILSLVLGFFALRFLLLVRHVVLP